MSRYVLGFLREIPPDPDLQITVLVRPQGKDLVKPVIKQLSNAVIDVLDIPHYSLNEQTKLLSYLNEKKFDLVHFIQFNHPIRYRGKFVVTIHDLTLFGHLYRKNKIKGFAFQQVMKSAVKNSAKIIAISETTKKAIIENYPVNEKKIALTYLGIDPTYDLKIKKCKLKIEEVKAKYGIRSDYLLYTGMWKRHKNIVRMLKAFEQYSLSVSRNQFSGKQVTDNGLQLVLAGKIDKNEPEVTELVDHINKKALSSRVSESESRDPLILTPGFVDEADLSYLYAGAKAYCIPSLSEGFGLPPLEAMAVGTPVISSNVSAMPEILGDAPLYFDPYDEKDMAKAIERVLSDEVLREKLVKKGIEQAKRYSWIKTAEETLKIYKELL
jgi:glycosyltransferase involved in cell wall biosynthesis